MSPASTTDKAYPANTYGIRLMGVASSALHVPRATGPVMQSSPSTGAYPGTPRSAHRRSTEALEVLDLTMDEARELERVLAAGEARSKIVPAAVPTVPASFFLDR